jgi:AP2 domain/HNH endonuclease
MHKQILPCEYPFQVDHIDGNKLNNQRFNLRRVTANEQQRNVGMRKDNKSGYKGVNWYPKTSKWRAYITVNGKSKTIGFFWTAQEAARAYDIYATEMFGDYAKTNKMLGNL